MGYKRETVELLRKFRQNMGSDLFMEDTKKIFKASVAYLEEGESNSITEKKIQYAKSYVKYLKVGNLVKFIGVSGSVAAKIAKEQDDIDIFVVVKNNTLWIYRGLMLVKNLFNRKMRKARGIEYQDQICVNLICEERGLKFDNDIFNLHELYFLVPIFNEGYYEEILGANQWLKIWGGVIPNYDRNKKRFNPFIEAFNLYFFLSQLFFMQITGHRPEIKRIFANYLKGRIEFYESDFKYEKLKLLNDIH